MNFVKFKCFMAKDSTFMNIFDEMSLSSKIPECLLSIVCFILCSTDKLKFLHFNPIALRTAVLSAIGLKSAVLINFLPKYPCVFKYWDT